MHSKYSFVACVQGIFTGSVLLFKYVVVPEQQRKIHCKDLHSRDRVGSAARIKESVDGRKVEEQLRSNLFTGTLRKY